MKNYKSPEINITKFLEEIIVSSTVTGGNTPEDELNNGGVIILPDEDVFGN